MVNNTLDCLWHSHCVLFVSYRLPLFSHHSDCFGTTDTPSRSSCGRRRRREGSTGGGFRTRYNYSASDNSSANTWHISPLPSSYLSSLFLCLSINTRLSFLWGQAHMISSKKTDKVGEFAVRTMNQFVIMNGDKERISLRTLYEKAPFRKKAKRTAIWHHLLPPRTKLSKSI